MYHLNDECQFKSNKKSHNLVLTLHFVVQDVKKYNNLYF